jgi:transglutaminase-like putative cysteine protease
MPAMLLAQNFLLTSVRKPDWKVLPLETMTDYLLKHKTHYEYEEEVSLCHNQLLITPPSNSRQTCFSHNIAIDPIADQIRQRVDYFGNVCHYFSIQQPHSSLSVTIDSRVRTAPLPVIDVDGSLPWEKVCSDVASSQDPGIVEYCFASDFAGIFDGARELALDVFATGKPFLRGAYELACLIKREFIYDSEATNILTPLSRVLSSKRGVCQDFTHLCLSAMRSIGLPCRYVSGYLETLPPPGKPKLRGADASHAWFSVYAPDQGWVDFDPTNGQLRTDAYIEAAVGRDYGDVAPLKGILFGGGKNTMKVEVDMLRQETVQA